jgi:hypothetical protein
VGPAVLVVLLATVIGGSLLVACGGGGGGGSDREGAGRPSWCATFSLVERVLEPHDRTVVDLVEAERWDKHDLAAGAVVALVGRRDAGDQRDLVDHLRDRHGAESEGERAPGLDPEVRELASEVDDALADGACG